MKRFPFISVPFLAAAAFACACSGADEDLSDMVAAREVTEHTINYSLGFPSTPTKGGGQVPTDSEKTINSLQVFVYDTSGKFEKVSSASIDGDGMSASGSVQAVNGDKIIFALANCGPVGNAGMLTLSGLRAKTIDLAGNSDGLVMTAQCSLSLTGDVNIDLTLSRLVSRVSVTSLHRAFTDPYRGAKPFSVTGVYLANVAGSVTLGGPVEASRQGVWYNRCSSHSDLSMDAFLFRQTDIPLAQGAEARTSLALYACPNDSAVPLVGLPWSERASRLVVVAELDGRRRFYPVDLPALEPNRSYSLALTFTSAGVEDPDRSQGSEAPLEINLTADITVSDWDTGETVGETF